MDFLTSTILAGLAWDGIKQVGSLTTDYLKGKLTSWLLNDQEIETIVSKINSIPEAYKKNEKFLELAIEDDSQLMDILKTIKLKNDSNVDFSSATIQNSTVNALGSGSIKNIHNYYSQNPQDFSKKKTREEVKKELQLLLSENAAVFKMYGPTLENKFDLLGRKHEAWRSMALKYIVPNNDKIIELLQENIELLNETEQIVFFKFKLHAEGFKDNQSRAERIAEYPQFPSEINNILGG
ncbi:hypothetical protein ACI2WT_15160 [Lysinibacillus fusiformis]